ncbi:MAG: hypothetical protein R2879_07250 [Saprospiraceae bacterium]
MHSAHLTRAILLPFMAAVAGYLSYVSELYHFFDAVSTPEWSVSAQMWRNFGFLYYIICMVLLYRTTFLTDPDFPLAFWMLIVLLIFHEIWAFQLFSAQSFNFALGGAVFQSILVFALPYFLWKIEKKLTIFFIPVVLWIGLYQLFWTYQVWFLTVGDY